MIIDFSFENFRSFKDLETLTMLAANISSGVYKEIDENNVFVLNSKIKLLKSKAIYGANACGKSNIIKAMLAFFAWIEDDKKAQKRYFRKFELSSETDNLPTFFQIIFAIKNADNEMITYRYGFEILNGEIKSEWLFGVPKRVEVPFFTRENMQVEVNPRTFKEGKKFENLAQKGDSEIYRADSLFLSSVKTMGGAVAKYIIEALQKIIIIDGIGIDDPKMGHFTHKKMQTEDKSKILELLNHADFNIKDIVAINETKDEIAANLMDNAKFSFLEGIIAKKASFDSVRDKVDADKKVIGEVSGKFKDWESLGTEKFFHLAAYLIESLENGQTLVIDEFDARLHPLLTEKIISLFNSNLTNPKNAQLIFVTHDTNLLRPSVLRRDQICFVEKSNFGVSSITTLVEYKGVRNDASYEKEYLRGAFGAVPFLNLLGSGLKKS